MRASNKEKSKNKKKPFDFFINQCSEIFRFLLDDYGMEMLSPKIYGLECSITFRRFQEIGITVMYEAGTTPWVLITAVLKIDGRLQSEKFALNHVIEERCPDLGIKECDFGESYQKVMTDVLLQYAKALKECCADILEGDFSILPKIKEREKADSQRGLLKE